MTNSQSGRRASLTVEEREAVLWAIGVAIERVDTLGRLDRLEAAQAKLRGGTVGADDRELTPRGQSGVPATSGWSVCPSIQGWQWSAYGPGGADIGKSATKEAAEELAQRAEQRLREPTQQAGDQALD